MGGVSLATAEGALGLLANPAAAASRPSTATGWFYWDFLLDAYTPGLGVDYDNNGTPQHRFNGTTGALNAGLVGMFGAWGVAVSVTGELRDFTLSGGTEASLSAAIWRLTLARSFADGEWVAGANLVGGGFNLRLPGSGVDLVDASDWSIEAGGLWQPRDSNLRIRVGSYWEPPRFQDVTGRLHLTLGLDVRFWSFSLCGSQYRMRVSLGADGARQYGNTVLSLGFWH